MRYSQPFGTPEPPLGSYPRYVNGNPTTGTEGSIPPARSFDEDQIEIITVISKVQEITGDPGLIPSHADLEQLWKALQALLARKYITTPIVKTVHTDPGGGVADFPDLHTAMTWVSEYTITWTGSVTFLLGPGKWTYTRTVELDHANSSRIFIQGAALKGAAPTPGNLSVTGYSAAARATDGNNQIIYLRSVFGTELAFTGGVTGFRVLSPLWTFRYLLLTGSQTIDFTEPFYSGGSGIYALDNFYYDCLACWGWGYAGVYGSGAEIYALTSLPIVCAFNQWGMELVGGDFIAQDFSDQIFVSNSVIGVHALGAHVWVWRLTCNGNGSENEWPGFAGLQGAMLNVREWLDCSINAGTGLYMHGNCNVYSEVDTGNWFNNNGAQGVTFYSGSTAFLRNPYFGGNGAGYAVLAQLGSTVWIPGATLAGELLSPPANEWGGYNSLIVY